MQSPAIPVPRTNAKEAGFGVERRQKVNWALLARLANKGKKASAADKALQVMK